MDESDYTYGVVIVVIGLVLFAIMIYYSQQFCPISDTDLESNDHDIIKHTITGGSLPPQYPCPTYPHTISYSGQISDYQIGVAHTQGPRPTMEDVIKVKKIGNNVHIGLYDGHSGDDVAAKASIVMPNFIEMNIKNMKPRQAILKAFEETEADIVLDPGVDENSTGSTALVAHLNPNGTCYMANLGDCRAILSGHGKSIKILTIDHKPDSPSEMARIKSGGGFVSGPTLDDVARINGMIAVSRSFGDNDFHPHISHEPDIFEFDMRKYEILVMACDGVWDVLDNDQVIEIASRCNSAKHAAEQIRNAAIQLDTFDNVSVVVVFHRNHNNI